MGVSLDAVARVVGTETSFVDLRGSNIALLPQRVALVGQGNTLATYATDPVRLLSAVDVGNRFGYGSPLHLAALELLPANGDGLGTIPLTIYPMAEGGGATPAVGDITVTGAATEAATYRVIAGGVASAPFGVSVGDAVGDIATAIETAVNGQVNMPVTASAALGVVTITSKWAGESANEITLTVEGEDVGVTFAITAPVGGTVDPDVSGALGQIVDVWETCVVNCLAVTNSTALNAYQAWGDGRWGALVKKPAFVVSGSVDPTPGNLTAIGDGRKTDRVNVCAWAPGSAEMGFLVGARSAARIVTVANGNPPVDYAGQRLTGILPGADSDQLSYAERDAAVKAGICTTEVVDGVVTLSDTVTFYHPDGEEPPAFRYVVDIVKLQNIVFNLDLIFNSEGWNGAPLIPDDQPTTNRDARKPKDAKAAVNGMIDSLGLQAILSDPETAKGQTLAVISSTNPKRLDVSLTVQLSGNANVISIDLNFGFFFGAAAVAA